LVALAPALAAGSRRARKQSARPDVAQLMGAHETVVMDDHQRVIDEVSALTGGAFCERVIEVTGAAGRSTCPVSSPASAAGWSSPASTRTACGR
jgi:hypothetical protein